MFYQTVKINHKSMVFTWAISLLEANLDSDCLIYLGIGIHCMGRSLIVPNKILDKINDEIPEDDIDKFLLECLEIDSFLQERATQRVAYERADWKPNNSQIAIGWA